MCDGIRQVNEGQKGRGETLILDWHYGTRMCLATRHISPGEGQSGWKRGKDASPVIARFCPVCGREYADLPRVREQPVT